MQKNIKYALPLLPFICFIAGYIISNLLIGTSSHQAPHLVGLTLHEALKITSQNHVAIKLVAEKECDGIAAGTIMTQKPGSGRLMKSNQAILVTVSKQPMVAITPTLLGKTKQQITKISKDNALKIKQYPQAHLTPEGTCIAQIPQPNMPLANQKIIVYTAQEKPNLYIMPNFVGKELTNVTQSLQHHQLQPTITYNYEKLNKPYPENLCVVAQKPHAGTFIILSPNLTISLEVEQKQD